MAAIEGGCFCGAVRYEARARPSIVTHCHCTMCRRSAGAVAITWATFEREHLTISGDSLVWHQSSPRALRGFCAQCGTSLFFAAQAEPHAMDVTVGSMDDPGECPPDRHIFALSKVPWLPLEPRLPCHVGDSNSPLTS